MLVRPFTDAGFPKIVAIYNQAIASVYSTFDTVPHTATDIARIVSKFTPREPYLILEIEDIAIGWGAIKRYSDRPGYAVCCETSTYLDAAKQGKGYGKHLQTALLEKAITFGYHHIVAKILASNPGSIEFHRRCGYKLVGIQKEIGYLNGQWHDIAILQAILPQVPPYTASRSLAFPDKSCS